MKAITVLSQRSMSDIFEIIIEQKHIDIRDHASTFSNSLYNGSCEIPEHHQCEIDMDQILTPVTGKNGFRLGDTFHSVYGLTDYKCDSKEGVKLSPHTVKYIKSGDIKIIVVWSWIIRPNDDLKIGDKIVYKIKGWIDAKEALALRDPVTGRFKYEKLNVL